MTGTSCATNGGGVRMTENLVIQLVLDYLIVGLLFAAFIFCWHNKQIAVLEDRRPWPLSLIPPMAVVYILALDGRSK